jgi:hypothetical protein
MSPYSLTNIIAGEHKAIAKNDEGRFFLRNGLSS